MSPPVAYLDWAATAPPDAAIAREALELSLAAFGNPSSKHSAGIEARARLEEARTRALAAAGAAGSRVVFTSGATESNNIALASFVRRPVKGGRVHSTGIEHPSAYKPLAFLEREGFRVSSMSALKDGVVEPAALRKSLDRESVLVSVMAVCNETGAVQPVGELAEIARAHSASTGRAVHFHCDAVQAFGKVPLELGAFDTVALSAHKLRGPKGAGILLARRSFEPVYSGGDQEGGMRPGTESLFSAWGAMRSVEEASASMAADREKALGLMERLFGGYLSIEGAAILPRGRKDPRDPRFSPFIACLALEGIPGEVAVRALGEEGVMLSSGSACSSGKRDLRVTLESGISKEDATASFRLSVGTGSTAEDIDIFLGAVRKLRARL